MQLRTTNWALFAVALLTATSAWAQAGGDTASGTATPGSTASDQAGNSAPAQNQSAPAAPAAASKYKFNFGGIDFSGMVDGYYSLNFNHPDAGFNQLYDFNDKTDQVDLNLLKMTASRDPDPIGFRVDIGVGRMFSIINPAPNPDPDFFRYVEQAYISVKPKGWKGFEADFGDFVTSAGAEVIETKDNWNYSRSLLFTLAIPYYHFGVRTSMPIGSSLTAGVQVINGWNAIVDDHGNNMQTVGLTSTFTKKKFAWTNNYYVGPQYTSTSNQTRGLYDTVLLLTPSDKINAYLNFDYGRQSLPGGGSNHWNGFAGAMHFQVTKHLAFSPRAEYYNDSSGFTTGTPQKLHEVTVTGEYKVLEGLLGRLEYRHDGSNEDFYNRGTVPGMKRTQNTITVGIVAWIAPKH